jgi:hypothetical protein
MGGRIPYYHKCSGLDVKTYIGLKNGYGEIFDPEYRLYKRLGGKLIRIQADYFKDPESLNYGLILKYNNIFYPVIKKWPFVAKMLGFLHDRDFVANLYAKI